MVDLLDRTSPTGHLGNGQMAKIIYLTFDGQVFRPDGPLDLPPNTRYLVTVERQEPGLAADEDDPYPLSEILRLATDMGVSDLSTRHSWYAHGRLEGA